MKVVEEETERENIDVVAIAKALQKPQVPEMEFTLKERLQIMTVKRLRQLASAKKIKNYGNLNKNALIAALAG